MDKFDRARDLGVEALGSAAKRGTKLIGEFRQFVLRGNVVDLAVGVVIGAAFGAIVKSLVEDILTPLLGFLHVPDFKDAFVGIGKHLVIDSKGVGHIAYSAKLQYGNFLNAIIGFLLISATVFFFVVKPVNKLMAKRKTEPDTESTTRECPECLSNIPRLARRCAFCTAEVGTAA